jgi:tRNA-splicing ligase RtcB
MSQFDHYDGVNVPIKAWTRGVQFEAQAREQLRNISTLPFIHHHIAAMPDVHLGIGATVGSVIPTKGAIIPAAVGVDIGCGMMAVRLGARAEQLPDSMKPIRERIERAVPVGNAAHTAAPQAADEGARDLVPGLERILREHPEIGNHKAWLQVGTLGGGNHFIEVCLDESGHVWVMLHSGSRGIGNKIGRYFIDLAKEDMRIHFINLPDKDLAYFSEGTRHFEQYVDAVGWAQRYALVNREVMMRLILDELARAADAGLFPPFAVTDLAVNCHHNYVALEDHFGANVYVTRKGAVRARAGELGIIPGSMGARSYIVEGLGNPDSFHSCSHGAGRVMSRNEAKAKISLDDHVAATAGIECRKDEGVLDESPAAYKPIDAVMAAQADLVRPLHELRQILCVKG